MESLAQNDTLSAVLIGFMGLIIFFLLYFFQRSRQNNASASPYLKNEKSTDVDKKKPKFEINYTPTATAASDSNRPTKPTKPVKKQFHFEHEWLSCTQNGHKGNVLDMDFSPNGKYLISCDNDRSCILWLAKDWSKHKAVTVVKVGLQLDHTSLVAFSPDSKAFIASMYNSRSLAIFKLVRSQGESDRKVAVTQLSEFTHQDPADPAELLSVGVASTGGFLMTCYSDTKIKLWSRKGDLLATIDTCHMTNSMAAVSPCGRFVASCGFTPDVKIWEVTLDKSGSGLACPPARAFELKGHNAQVDWLAFSGDSTRMATVSKDTTWKLWNISVRYKQGEDPKLLVTGRYKRDGPCRIALSPDARCVAIATGSSVTMHSCLDATELVQFSGVHVGSVAKVLFHPKTRYLATCGADRHINVLLNVPGAQVTLQDCSAKAKATQSRAQREMFEQEMAEARGFLAMHGVADESGRHAGDVIY